MQQPPPMHQQQWGPPRGMAPRQGLGMAHPMNMPPRPYHMGAPRPIGGAGVGVVAGQITSRPPMLNMHPRGMPMTMTMPVATPGVPPVSLYIGQVKN